MVSFTLSALVAALTSSLALAQFPRPDTPGFYPSVVVTRGNTSFNGYYLTTYHDGAGFNALVLCSKKPCEKFHVNAGFLDYFFPDYKNNNSQYLETMLNPGRPEYLKYNKQGTHSRFVFSAPPAYRTVECDNVQGKPKESDARQGTFSYPKATGTQPLDFAPAPGYNFETFSVCPVGGVMFYEVELSQLLYRPKGTEPHPECADVTLLAHFVS